MPKYRESLKLAGQHRFPRQEQLYLYLDGYQQPVKNSQRCYYRFMLKSRIYDQKEALEPGEPAGVQHQQ